MYTVSRDELPSPEFVTEAIGLMAETFQEVADMPHLTGLQFSGEVYRDTTDPESFQVEVYCGRITSLVVDPPIF